MNSIKKIYKKNRIINSNDVNRDFLIYQGQNFVKISVTKELVGFKFGELIQTRKVVQFRKK